LRLEEKLIREWMMSKYDPLWKYVQSDGRETFTLSFDEIGRIAGV
jgi:hypothetical protein